MDLNGKDYRSMSILYTRESRDWGTESVEVEKRIVLKGSHLGKKRTVNGDTEKRVERIKGLCCSDAGQGPNKRNKKRNAYSTISLARQTLNLALEGNRTSLKRRIE